MSQLPNLFVTRFDGLANPMPMLVQTIDEPRKITLRTWAECPEATEGVTKLDINCHGAPVPGRTYPDIVIDGGLLADRLKGIHFRELGCVCLNLDHVCDLHEGSDMARWMFPLQASGAPALPYNVRALTCDNKVTGTRHLMVSQTDCALVVFVYFADLDFTEASFLVVGHPAHGAVGGLADRAKIIAPEDQVQFSLKSEPRIVLSGPESVAVGGEAEIEVKLTSSGGRAITGIDTDLFLETTGGHLPLTRVPLVAGKGKFRVTAPWNTVGDQFKVKAGFRHVSGLAEHALTVTA